MKFWSQQIWAKIIKPPVSDLESSMDTLQHIFIHKMGILFTVPYRATVATAVELKCKNCIPSWYTKGAEKWGLFSGCLYRPRKSHFLWEPPNGMLKLCLHSSPVEGVHEWKLAHCVCVWVSWDSSVAKATTNFQIRVNSFTECTVSFNKLDSSEGAHLSFSCCSVPKVRVVHLQFCVWGPLSSCQQHSEGNSQCGRSEVCQLYLVFTFCTLSELESRFFAHTVGTLKQLLGAFM